MRRWIHALLAAIALLSLPIASAQAITCFLVYDRNDNAIYQDTRPPVDMSERGAAERQALYRRGEHLIVMESDNCPVILFFTGAGGTSALFLDEVVGGVPTTVRSDAASGSAPRSSRGAAGAAPKSQSGSAAGASKTRSGGY